MTATITISGHDYVAYASVASATIHFAGQLGDAATAWALAGNAAKLAPALVSASRLLDRIAWRGEPVGTPVFDVVLQWPRTGIDDVDSSTIPDKIVQAAYELAGAILVDPTILSKTSSGSNVKRVDAGGGVGVTFFKDTLDTAARFPANIQELIAAYVASESEGASVSGSYASGTSSRVSCDDFDLTEAL